jgi:hypothetical protein
MAQFGSGSEFAAQCPQIPPPDGWRPWTDNDGPVPDSLGARAKALTDDTSIPLGTTESFPLPGVTTLLRLEPRLWSRDTQANLVEGCFRSTGIYLPSSSAGAVSPPSETSLTKTVGVLTAASLLVGIVASLAAWGASK